MLRPLVKNPPLLPVERFIGTSRILRYDANLSDENYNTVTVNVLNRELNNYIIIDSYSNFGFRLTSGVFALGPIAVLPTAMFSWTVGSHHDINVKSLSLFWMMEPKVDIIVIGTGDKRMPIDQEIREFLHKKRIAFEVQDTRVAVSAYNFLACELRNVGAAFIPPETMSIESIEEGFISYNLKNRATTTFPAEHELDVEDLYLQDAQYKREYEKWWSHKGKNKPLPPGLTEDYKEKLQKWKERKDVEDDRVEDFQEFEMKSESVLIKERARKESAMQKQAEDEEKK